MVKLSMDLNYCIVNSLVNALFLGAVYLSELVIYVLADKCFDF